MFNEVIKKTNKVMEKQNESAERLKVGRDYVNLHDNDVVVIDRVSGILNKGFERLVYKNYLSCSGTSNWREATEEEVIEAFRRHLVHRYGEDWETMKVKEIHPSLEFARPINDGSWYVEISKEYDGWNVWNKNGLLYCKGIWVERLEEKEGEMNINELKIRALLEGLEAENIEEFMREAKISDYRNYGKAYVSAARNKIKEKKPLFITEDGVELSSNIVTLYAVDLNNQGIESPEWDFKECEKMGLKIFYYKKNADKYIEENKPKPLFVTEDGFKFFSETSIEFYIVVNFIKYRSTISDFEDQKKLSHKVFYHESNADEYIAWHKKGFSVNDLLLADIGITTKQLDKLHQMAIKKI